MDTQTTLGSALLLVGLLSLAEGQNCRMEDFPVQANFDQQRFSGKWYELKWIIEPWIPPEWNYLDYFAVFTPAGDDFRLSWQGREEGKEFCASGSTNLYSTGENAKYIYERKKKTLNSSYWIMDTDYDNYALVYGCRELASNGTCVAPDCWQWSRRPQLEDSYVKRMDDRLPELCLTVDMLLVTKQEKECTTQASDAPNVIAKWTPVIVLLMALLATI